MHNAIAAKQNARREKLLHEQPRTLDGYPITPGQLPDGIASFNTIRDLGYKYIDKTKFLEQMLRTGQKFYFISRPRKFGKSLTCRTIESCLWGDKDKFIDLAIHNHGIYTWPVYPVIYLDFSTFGKGCTTGACYAKAIVIQLESVADEIRTERANEKNANPKVRIHADCRNGPNMTEQSLTNLVKSLKKAFSNNVAIVIDEYDSAITQSLQTPKIMEAISKVLHAFYSVIKGLEEKLRLVFITGVARFTQSYLFSSMNNLDDISLNEDFSDMMGFSRDEMKELAPYIEEVVQHKKTRRRGRRENATYCSEFKEIEEHFDGYQFTRNGPQMFHPSFLMTYLRTKEHNAYKVKHPEPQFLLDMLPTRFHSPTLFLGVNATEEDLCGITDPKNIELKPLLFQTGIFSIKKYYDESDVYFLHYPNKYMKEKFSGKLFARLMKPFGYLEKDYRSFLNRCNSMMNYLLEGDETNIRMYFDELNILATRRGYYSFPRQPSGENKTVNQQEGKDNGEECVSDMTTPAKQFESRNTSTAISRTQEFYFRIEGAFQFMMEICLDVAERGPVAHEDQLSSGRSDLRMEVEKKTILIETKVKVTDAAEGMNQLLSQYATAYLNNGKTVVCIAISFDAKKIRNVLDWIYIEYDEKGKLTKFFSREKRNVNEMNLFDISIT